MNKSIEKKLLHFFTGGDIREDFAAARKRKTAKLRRLIRACFYVHLAAAVICIALAVVLKAGTAGIIAISVCEVVLLLLAFLAVGDATLIKTLLCCGDTAFSAAMFVTGALISNNENSTPYFAVGAVMIIVTLCAFGAYYAAMCKEFLDNFSPQALNKEHYTYLPQLSKEVKAEEPEEEDAEAFEEVAEDSLSNTPEEHELPKTEKKPEPPAPPKTEIQILAERLREILCTPKSDNTPDTVAEAMPKTQPQTETIPVIPENPDIEVNK